MIYENVVELSKTKNMTLSDIEEKADLGNGTISKWKESSPKVSTLQAVAKVLGVSVSRLLKE